MSAPSPYPEEEGRPPPFLPMPPALGDEFYPFATERRGGPGAGAGGDPDTYDPGVLLQRKEQDLLLAAELGKMLLEQNEELRERCQVLALDQAAALERLEQEKYELRRQLASGVAEWQTRGAELEGDLAALRAQLGHQRLEQQDTSRESSHVAQELSEQNQRLAEQLSQASQLEQQLQDELMALRVENRTLGMSSAEHAAQTQSLQAENLMLQERKQELERQTRQRREETEAVQGLVETLHETLLLRCREVHEKELQAQQLRAEAEELRVSNKWLQRRVTEMTDEIRLHDSDASVASLQSEIEQSGEGSPEQNGGPAKLLARTIFEAASGGPKTPARGSEEEGEYAKRVLALTQLDQDLLRQKEVEIQKLHDQLTLQHVELCSLRGELANQRRLFQESDRDETLKLAVADRDEAIIKKGQMELELAQVSLERDSMSQQLLAAIRQKMALSQELEGWQDDMEFIIKQQLKLQWQQEGIPMSPAAPSRTPEQAKTSPFSRCGNSAPNGTSFLSLFKKS
ncbi:BICD family-like cargo adapter 2 [Dermochelys coriacea]|uniref:BICD family-like cargo adapter 2 n=1 Tax=Dermochelys coriacea TaxID=27794 RepID=UPI0018E7116B|nr:BICD family-like cargo adapter 2 [Dermochelys coriacea]